MDLRFGKDNEGKKIKNSPFSVADELAKLTNLSVQGMITEEDFVRRKQEIIKKS